MTNSREALRASRCTVDIRLNGTLSVTVTDNGLGADHPTGTGVGWSSMTERAAELGRVLHHLQPR
jgi:signal transduction histidine kinase